MKSKFWVIFLLLTALSCQSMAPQAEPPNSLLGNISLAKKKLLRQRLYDTRYLDVEGREIVPAQLPAAIIIVNFWASWCPPCMEELPAMIAMTKDFSEDELQIISINTETENQSINIKKTLQKFPFSKSFITIADQHTAIADSVHFSSIPVSVIFHHGEVVQFIDGPMNFNSALFKQNLKKLLER